MVVLPGRCHQTDKLRYRAGDDAADPMVVIVDLHATDRFTIYRCPDCGSWHVGRPGRHHPKREAIRQADGWACLCGWTGHELVKHLVDDVH